MQKVLVSIIIPAYNAERFLARAVDSVLAQTYTNIEVVIVDDGSTDDTWQIMQNFADTWVRVFHQMNMGACVARNRGFEESHGEYVKFFDADDIMYPDAIEKQLNHILSLPKGWLSVGKFYLPGYPDRGDYSQTIDADGRFKMRNAIWGNCQTATVLYPRDVFESLGGFDAKMEFAQDHELMLSCAVHGCRVRSCDIVLFEYDTTINPQSIRKNKQFPITTLMYLYYKYQDLFSDKKMRQWFVQYCWTIYVQLCNVDNLKMLIRFLHRIGNGDGIRAFGSRTFGWIEWNGSRIFNYRTLQKVTTHLNDVILKLTKRY